MTPRYPRPYRYALEVEGEGPLQCASGRWQLTFSELDFARGIAWHRGRMMGKRVLIRDRKENRVMDADGNFVML